MNLDSLNVFVAIEENVRRKSFLFSFYTSELTLKLYIILNNLYVVENKHHIREIILYAIKTLRAMKRAIKTYNIISSFSMITKRIIIRVRRAIRAYNIISSFLISTKRIILRSLRLSLSSILKLAFISISLLLSTMFHLLLLIVN